LKVLEIYKDYWPVIGGIEHAVRELAVGLRRDYRVATAVLATNTGRRSWRGEIDGVPVWKVGRIATVARAPVAPGLLAALRRLRPDVADLHFPYPFGELAYLLAGRGRRLVVTYHSDIVRQQALLRLYRPFLRRLLERADRIVASSPNYAASSPFLQDFGDKVVVIPYGIDVDRFSGADPGDVADVRRRYGEPLILFVGQYRYYKGIEYLVAAMPQVDPRARLLLVGAGIEGAVGERVGALGVADRVHFAGETPNAALPKYHHAASILCLPASHRSEAFGIAQLEGMAAGLPVVTTEVGTGTSYVTRDGVTGLVVPPRDPAALAAAINRLLADEPLRRRMGAAARRRADGEFTLARMLERRFELYRSLVD
jgi:glycosyltransferase involved in cell wall biosynthesis